MQADGNPQFIIMMEDAQKKARWAGMLIAKVELVMMASAAVFAAQHFPREVDDWEGLPASSRTWQAWKVAFRLAHLKCQHQLQALGGGKYLGGAHAVIPSATPTMDRIGAAFKNLVLVASNDTTVLHYLEVDVRRYKRIDVKGFASRNFLAGRRKCFLQVKFFSIF